MLLDLSVLCLQQIKIAYKHALFLFCKHYVALNLLMFSIFTIFVTRI